MARQGGGKGAFAHVWVTIERSRDGVGSITFAPHDALPMYRQEPELVSAAIASCGDAYALLYGDGTAAHSWHVRITKFVMSMVDTTPEVMRAAACFATLQAHGKGDAFTLVCDDGWHVRPKN